MASQEEINTPLIAAVGTVSVILLTALILVLVILYQYQDKKQDHSLQESASASEVEILVARQEAKLAGLADPEGNEPVEGIVPIDDAMEQVLVELRAEHR